MFGRPPKDMAEIYDEIMDFAELWEFEDVALKNFSTGMVARLGFAVATCVKPEILIVDEVLGVGDYKFQEKCEGRISDMISGGTTVLLVSHSISSIKEMCSRAILLARGEVVCVGDVEEVCEVYGDAV
jgi:ABC-type polysaccharide/polyol phosphate transport system ATPase subunit